MVGTTWTPQSSGTIEWLWGVCFTDLDNGFIVGTNGTILRTTDGGENWTSQISGTQVILFDVSYTNEYNAIAVGDEGTILKTTNGGTSWTPQSIGTTAHLGGISFTDLENGTAVGDAILRTTDGGITWIEQTSGTNQYLYDVSFTDSNNGTAVGASGTILRTTNGGYTFVEEEKIDEIPTSYNLSNNYPNPFNPTTAIRYQIPELSFVTIKIYDVLGNEIETLVNEEKATGTYELTWFAEQLPSGIYFYRLQAGSFIETKKMVFLK
jgi:photosystem II stability/assembly factor-like uncharacterized protein